MRKLHRSLLVFLSCIFLSPALAAQDAQVDISACRGMYAVLRAMHEGARKEKVAGMLDALLDRQPYQVMFKHYNRSWRPNELPKPVFKRMILSLRFAEEYEAGENQRADTMRTRWVKFYPDLSRYEDQLHQLESADLPKLINEGVHFAQDWLPKGWTIPNFYLAVIPNGGSPAFSIDGAQGYDFLQLPQERLGELDLNWLVGTIAHESHHLGMRLEAPTGLSPAQTVAMQVLFMCVPEGAANYFISGAPAARAPAFPETHFHVLTPDLTKAWSERTAEEEEMVQHQVAMLDRALAGTLTEDTFNAELRDYWFNGAIGRGYVLGSDMFGAIHTAFGKAAAISAMQDPRKFFQLYNQALDAKPDLLKRCVRIPDKAVKQALAI